MLKVEGPENLIAYSGKEVDETYLGSAILSQDSTVEDLEKKKRDAISADPKIAGLSKEILMEKGKRVYTQTCFACHMANGEGMPGVFPPLAKSDYLMADKDRAIRAVIKGLAGPIKVNEKDYNGVMPPVTLSDEQVSQVLTYVRNEWGNTGEIVTADEVRKVRAEPAH